MLKIQNILILFNFLYFLSKEEMINNPFLITNHNNPIILQNSQYFFIYTSGEFILINKSTGQKESSSAFGTYSSPYIWISDESNNYYIYSTSVMYKVVIPSSYSTVTKPSIQFPTSTKFIGYIQETEYTGDHILPGCICSGKKNEIIIYGKLSTSDTKIVFSFFVKSQAYILDFSSIFAPIEDQMSCKIITNGQYACAIVSYNHVFIIVLLHTIKTLITSCQMELVSYTGLNDVLKSHTDVNMYDLNNPSYKLVCARNITSNNIECLYFNTTISNIIKDYTHCISSASFGMSEIIVRFPVDSNTEGDCSSGVVGSENLFCCEGKDSIRCARIKSNFEYIDTFDLKFPGDNTEISIFFLGATYSAIFFLNHNYEDSIYEYFIYIPTCQDLDFNVIVYHSINEDYESDINLNELFNRDTNTKYYIEFLSLPEDYGDLLVNEEKIILGNNSVFLLEENEQYILDFNSTNDNIIDNFQILYKIFIEETYSSTCSINLTILPCYDSCSRCSKDKASSTEQNHNCIEDNCKINYYPAPLVVTNCFKEEEKEPNWYLDYTTMRFALCDTNCATCYGPASDNCLTCYSLLTNPDLAYLVNGKCINECPEGTFPVEKTGGYYQCKSCYPNCKTCSELGTNTNMKCDSCNENNIKYSKNCYIEYNPNEKTFYKPGSTTQITSCYEFLDLYIEVNTYECINTFPSTGYFLVNPSTGLFAQCHQDCKTCSQNYTETSSKCESCLNEEYFLLEGNCVPICPEGYFPSLSNGIKICKKCYKNCQTCDTNEIYTNGKLTNMNCLTCKKVLDPNDNNNYIENKIKVDSNCFPIITYSEQKIIFDITELSLGQNEKTCLDYSLVILYGQYQCITKELNHYYVLNNEENTGVVKECDIACQTCNGAKNEITSDTNCITCKEGYYKKEESNTNCIEESLIPENYFKNNLDNIYYKCYINCKKCDGFYNNDNNNENMHCVECITDYYFVYGSKNCYDMSFTEGNDYYFNERDNQFHKCYFSCFKCSQLELDEFHHNCDECISGFYFEFNTNNCYNDSVLERGYYFDDFTIGEGDEPVYKKCYENCKTCNDSMKENNMNCIICKDDFHKIKGTNNCYDDSLTEQGYYLKEDYFYPCEENCKTCFNSRTIIDNILSYNCLSCDYLTKNLYLVYDLNNCEPESFKENGYYLKEDQDNPDTKIFYKCYLSCSLCDKEKQFDPLTNKDNHNCLKCNENYYPLKNDINPKNCYNAEEMIPNGYILVRNYWQICHENCESCIIKPEYDSKNKLISQNCLSCYGDLHFIYGTSDCSNESIIENGYYLDDSDLMYHKCDIQCKKCDKYSTALEPKCIKCNIDLGYYPADKKPLTNCYNKTTIDKEYILSSMENTTTGEITRKWTICYKTCKTCINYGDDYEHKCITCISKYYLIYGTTNCVQNDYAERNGYYFNTTYGQFVKCYKACITCSGGLNGENTNCKKCNEELGYYPIKGKGTTMCYNNETIKEGFFLNNYEEPFAWEECYENCATCKYKGNANKMACLSCKTNLINKEYNKTIYFKFSQGNCKISCPNNLFLTKQLDCVPSCLNNTYEYIPNVTCVDTCPENYIINAERTRCVFSSFSGTTSPSVFKDIIFSNLSSFIDSSTVINGTNFIAQVIKSEDIDPIEQIKNGISGLDFGDCIDTLKTQYNIPPDEDLIVIEIETKEDKEKNKELNYDKDAINLGKNVKVSICDKDGNILDMSYCTNEITVMKYVGDVEEIDISTAMDYADQGIDVFNAQDSFFNDRCHHFDSDKDVILTDRRDDYFQNVTFCDEGCVYNGMDYTYMIAKCSCDAGNMQDGNVNIDELDDEDKKGITLNDLANSFTSEIFSFNFDVVKCYNLVFNINILKHNKGFFSFIILFSMQLIFLIYFSVKKLKPIRNYMLVFEPFNPRVDPPHPPKQKIIKHKSIYDLLGVNNINNNREAEIKKTKLISDLLNRNKSRKKSKKNEPKNFGDDAIVVHYENSDNSVSIKSDKQKDFDDSLSNDNNINSNPKIYGRNKKDLIKSNFHIFSKETILENTRNKQTMTLETNKDTSPTKDEFIYGNIFKKRKGLKKYHSNKTNNFKHFKNNKEKKINIIKERYEDSEDEKNISKNKKTLKHTLKNRNKNLDIKLPKESLKSLRVSKSVKYYYKNKQEEKINQITKNEEMKKTEENIDSNKEIKKQDKLGNMRLKYKRVKYSFSNEDLNDMDYDAALFYDHRSFIKIYFAYLLEEHIIFNTFCTDLYLELRSIKMSFLVFGIEINFFLNALFYTDEYISDTYHNNGILDFFSSLPKSIYSFIVTFVISSLLKMLSSSKKQLMKIIEEKEDKDKYLKALDNELNKLKKKLMWFFIIVFILGIFFSYYASAFCAVYMNSQTFWLIGCLESVVLDFLTPFVICFVLSILRYIGLKKRIKCIYNSAKYVGIII